MRTLLIARALIGFWFAMRFAQLQTRTWEPVFDLLADYLVVDGVAGIVVAAVFLRAGVVRRAAREWRLGVVFLADGIGRALSGVAVHRWPGISGFPVTALVFIGVMAACTAGVGLTEVVLVATEEKARHGHYHRSPQFAAIPVAIAAVAAIIFGVAAIRRIDDIGRFSSLLTDFIAAASCIMLAMAWSQHTRAR